MVAELRDTHVQEHRVWLMVEERPVLLDSLRVLTIEHNLTTIQSRNCGKESMPGKKAIRLWLKNNRKTIHEAMTWFWTRRLTLENSKQDSLGRIAILLMNILPGRYTSGELASVDRDWHLNNRIISNRCNIRHCGGSRISEGTGVAGEVFGSRMIWSNS